MNRKDKPERRVCYVVKSFPRPSETFIAEEAFSLYSYRVTPAILSLYAGSEHADYDSAHELLDKGAVYYLGEVSRLTSLIYLVRLFFVRPRNVLSCLKAMFTASEDRWRYFQLTKFAFSLAKKSVDYIHAHFADENLLCASILSKLTGIPYGVTTHGYDLRTNPIPLGMACEAMKGAHAVIAISQYNRRVMANKYGLELDRVEVVHCGIRIDQFQRLSKFKEKHGETVKLLTVGRLVGEKGQKFLLEAISELKSQGKSVSLNIVGEGPLREEFESFVSMYDLSGMVTLLGVCSQKKVKEELENADVFVMPSIEEGIPVACMEAMAMNLPVIATRITGIPELIDDGVNGVLVSPKNVVELVSAISLMIDSPDKRARMSKAAREKIVAEFERDVCTSRLIAAWKL